MDNLHLTDSNRLLVLYCLKPMAILLILWLIAEFVRHVRDAPISDTDSVPLNQRMKEIRRHAVMGATDANNVRVVGATIGWRLDPFHRKDGQTKVVNGNGLVEHQRVIREKK